MSDHLTDAETFMWRLGRDPWLASTYGALSLLDGPVDLDRLRERLLGAAIRMQRLRQRVLEGRGQNPRWITDPEFDLAFHLRHLAMPSSSTDIDLLDFAARLVDDPFDKTRPLWTFYVIDHGDGSAVLTKLHHSLADGAAGIQLALEYMELSATRSSPDRDDPDSSQPDSSELAKLIRTESPPDDPKAAWAEAVKTGANDRLGRLRHGLGEVAMYLADRPRIGEHATALFDGVKETAEQLSSRVPPSPIWTNRSRRRTLRRVSGDLPTAVEAARSRGGSLNDLLLAATAEAAHRVHRARHDVTDVIPGSFIVSTRSEGEVGGNAFSPASIGLPIGEMTLDQRFDAVVALALDAKSKQDDMPDLFEALAGPARLIPSAGLALIGRQQAAKLDLATSNLRSSPVPVWVAGARIVGNCPIGPVGGAAANLTLMSYCDQLDIGIHADPSAIDDVDEFVACFADAWAALTRHAA